MRYREFENAISPTRIDRYLVACRANTRKAMTLYRLNLRMSQELYTVVSCFEVTLRNAIDRHYTQQMGTDWLRNAVAQGGIFDVFHCSGSSRVINRALNNLGQYYTHSKLVAEMEFGFWRYLFARAQFLAGNQSLLRIFPLRYYSADRQGIIFISVIRLFPQDCRGAGYPPFPCTVLSARHWCRGGGGNRSICCRPPILAYR